MSILKATGVAVDINAAPDVVANARLISVLNTGAAFPLVNVGTGNNLYIAARRTSCNRKGTKRCFGCGGGNCFCLGNPYSLQEIRNKK